MGDGTGGLDVHVTNTQSEKDCEAFVKTNAPSANGATWDTTGKKCFAEYGMTGTCRVHTCGHIEDLWPRH